MSFVYCRGFGVSRTAHIPSYFNVCGLSCEWHVLCSQRHPKD